jgi:uncharacterized membrane protein
MVGLLFLGLIGLGLYVHGQNSKLSQQLGELRNRLALLNSELEHLRSGALPAQPSHEIAPSPALMEPEPEPQAEPVPAETFQPRIIMTEPEEVPTPEPLPSFYFTPLDEGPPPVSAPEPESQFQHDGSAPRSAIKTPSVSDWLSQNGLAWIGGGALALGGAFLVAYAAQRGLFTAGMRIWASILLGLMALVAGEAMRRGVPRMTRTEEDQPNRLVAALTTAAGAAIVFAALWASYSLYHFIGAPAAVAALAGVSLALLGLSLLHGEALALLAISAAFLIPLIVDANPWSEPVMTVYLAAVVVTGLAASGLRGWARSGLLTLVGAALWGAMICLRNFESGAAILSTISVVVALGACILWRRRSRADAEKDLLESLILRSLIGSAVVQLIVWRNTPTPPVELFDLGLLIHIGAAILASRLGLVRREVTGQWLLFPVAIMLFVASSSIWMTPDDKDRCLWLLPPLAALVLAGPSSLWSRAQDQQQREPTEILVSAGVAAICLTLLSNLFSTLPRGADVAIDAGFALLLALGAVLAARRSFDVTRDIGLAALVAASAEVLGLALHAGLGPDMAPTAYGLEGLGLAALAVQWRWRGAAESAAIACLASLIALAAAPVSQQALLGSGDMRHLAAVALGAILTQSAAWWLLRGRSDLTGSRDAVSITALTSGLLTGFMLIQLIGAAPGHPGALPPFINASLKALMFLSAGTVLAARVALTPLSRIRAPIVLGLGVLMTLLGPAIWLHPWWGSDAAAVIGPPLADSLALGLLAPALVLGAAAALRARACARHGTVQSNNLSPMAAVCAVLFAAVWLISEIRRLYCGPVLTVPTILPEEMASYGLGLFALSTGLDLLRRRFMNHLAEVNALNTLTEGLVGLTGGANLLCLIWLASPWWGPLGGELHWPALMGVQYAAGIALTGFIALRASREQHPAHSQSGLAQAARVAAGIEIFVFLTLIIRYGFHGDAMQAPLKDASAETWTYSAAWAVYGLAALAFGSSRGDQVLRGLGLVVLLGTTAKVFLFDTMNLEGVIRAGSFLALGVVLLAGALAARRLTRKGQVEEGE